MPNFKQEIHSKLPNVGTSIFSVMSKLAFDHEAINLSQGYPDYPSSTELIELVDKAMKEGYNQYAPMPGIYSLRRVIADKIQRLYGCNYNPENEITITAGATQAIFTAISAVIDAGDEVIIFAPSYDSYAPSIRANGGVPVEIELTIPSYRVDWNRVSDAISAKTKMILINTPHNPTGTILSKEDMVELQAIVKNSSIVVLSDEVYEHMVFDGLEHNSAARFPSLAERSFIVASFGKTFHNTGWKMGYCAGTKELMNEFRKIHQFNVFSVNHPIQRALATFLSDSANYEYLPSFFEEKRNLFLKAIQGSRFTSIPSKGTYFQLLGYKEISVEKDVDLAKRLTVDHKLASIPVSAFYEKRTDHKVLRFCFAKSEETLLKGAEILNKL